MLSCEYYENFKKSILKNICERLLLYIMTGENLWKHDWTYRKNEKTNQIAWKIKSDLKNFQNWNSQSQLTNIYVKNGLRDLNFWPIKFFCTCECSAKQIYRKL